MGEGMTPLIRCDRLGAALGLNNLYVKDDSRNPTWSFKDRMASVGASMALDFETQVLTAASSGNAGAATAAYAARAGLQAVVFTALKFPLTMRMFMQAYGTKIMATPTAPDRSTMVLEGVQEHGWFPIQTMMQPPIGACVYSIEGNKTFAYELCEQLDWQPPDVVVAPCSGGDSIAGAWRGFNEWRQLGYIDKVPRMVALQTYGILRRALESGANHPSGDRPAAERRYLLRHDQQLLSVPAYAPGFTRRGHRTPATTRLWPCSCCWLRPRASGPRPRQHSAWQPSEKLRDRGDIGTDQVVVAWITSGGLKDPTVMEPYVPRNPLESSRHGTASAPPPARPTAGTPADGYRLGHPHVQGGA